MEHGRNDHAQTWRVRVTTTTREGGRSQNMEGREKGSKNALVSPPAYDPESGKPCIPHRNFGSGGTSRIVGLVDGDWFQVFEGTTALGIMC